MLRPTLPLYICYSFTRLATPSLPRHTPLHLFPILPLFLPYLFLRLDPSPLFLFLLFSYPFPTIFLPYSYPFLPFSYPFPTLFLPFSYPFPTLFLPFSYPFPTSQLCPRYEGQLTWMAEPICHFFRSLVRHHSGLRTDGQGRTERVIERGRCLRTILRAVCGDGGGVRRGPRTTTSFGPQRELPQARLVIHRQTSAQNSVGVAGRFRRGWAY